MYDDSEIGSKYMFVFFRLQNVKCKYDYVFTWYKDGLEMAVALTIPMSFYVVEIVVCHVFTHTHTPHKGQMKQKCRMAYNKGSDIA